MSRCILRRWGCLIALLTQSFSKQSLLNERVNRIVNNLFDCSTALSHNSYADINNIALGRPGHLLQTDDETNGSKSGLSSTHSMKLKTFENKSKSRDGTSDLSSDDFERLLITGGKCSYVWIRLIAHQLQHKELTKAREVAEKGLVMVEGDEERLNMWTAYMGLECLYGTEESCKNLITRAEKLNCADKSKNDLRQKERTYLNLCSIYERIGKFPEAQELYTRLTQKFVNSDNVWIEYIKFLYKMWVGSGDLTVDLGGADENDKPLKLLPKALARLEKRKHIPLTQKVALLEMEFGDFKRGQKLYEKLLSEKPKRSDLWNVYLDRIVKHMGPNDVRQQFNKCLDLAKVKLINKKFFIKKWLDYEFDLGDDIGVEEVIRTASEIVQREPR